MEDAPKKTTPVKATGRRYNSVDELIRSEQIPAEIAKGVKKLSDDTRVTRTLAAFRVRAGLTQSELAKKLDCSQSAISKLEAGQDKDLTLGEIKQYSDVLGERLGLGFGPPMNHVEAIKAHALSMKARMLALTTIANADSEFEKDIQAFFGEAFFNILSILATCQNEMPNGLEHGIKVDLLDGDTIQQSNRAVSSRSTPQVLT